MPFDVLHYVFAAALVVSVVANIALYRLTRELAADADWPDET